MRHDGERTRQVRVLDPLSRFSPEPPSPGTPGDPGLFGPGSAAWRVWRERALLSSGPAALLLQVAHPLVAAGVAAHSDFTGDPLRRLHGTIDAVLAVTFGDSDQVRAAVQRVARLHRPVQGTLPVTTGPVPAGTPYRAGDGELGLWVFTSLVWTAITATDAFVRRVPLHERERYYREMTDFARLFGVPASALPDDYAALERYLHAQVRDVLSVGADAAGVAQQVLRPDPPIVAAPVRPLPVLLAAGLLPPAVRDAYGLHWRRRERIAFRAVQVAARPTVRLLPHRLRYWPHYLLAERRLGR